MKEGYVVQQSRRGFLKGAGVAAIGALAATSALGMSGCSSSASAEAKKSSAGIKVEDDSIYTDIFTTATRNLPVLDVPTDMVRQGPVAFEQRIIAASEIVETVECDVLVIGCGITGSCAALAASDDSSTKVVCIEKMDVGRGMFEGMGVIGGKRMLEAGNNIDPVDALDELYRSAYYRTPAAPTRCWAHRSGEAADWLQDRLDEGDQKIKTIYAPQKPYTNGFNLLQTELSFTSDQWSDQTKNNAGGGGLYIVRDLSKVLGKRSNVDLRYNTGAAQLIQTADGSIVGALAKGPNGYLKINAAGGVILATGGYDANPDMMKAWCRSEDIANSASWCPNLGTTGDGHMMGLMVGASMDPIPHAVMNFNWGSPDSFYSTCFGISTALASGLMINEHGKRFCNEGLPFQARGNAISGQVGYGVHCWTVWDGSMLGATPDAALAGIASFEEKGWCVQSDDIAGLEKKMEVPQGSLAAEVERWNGFVDKGKDEDFKRFMTGTKKIAKGPFYAIIHQQSILATVSGLIVDGDTHVLDAEGEPIKGLYAGGNASGGMFSGNYPRHIPGPSAGRCVTFGYVAGRNAAKGA